MNLFKGGNCYNFLEEGAHGDEEAAGGAVRLESAQSPYKRLRRRRMLLACRRGANLFESWQVCAGRVELRWLAHVHQNKVTVFSGGSCLPQEAIGQLAVDQLANWRAAIKRRREEGPSRAAKLTAAST